MTLGSNFYALLLTPFFPVLCLLSLLLLTLLLRQLQLLYAAITLGHGLMLLYIGHQLYQYRLLKTVGDPLGFLSGFFVDPAFLHFVPWSVFVMDGISLLFVTLTVVIFTICFFYLPLALVAYRFWLFTLLSLELLSVLAFATNNFLWFYLLMEMTIIPMYLIIIVWGSRGRRFHAAYYFFFYTMLGSLFMLLGLVLLYQAKGNLAFLLLDSDRMAHSGFRLLADSSRPVDSRTETWISLLLFLGFASKVPVAPLHLWLPEAHVESPTVGSVILASLLMKMGAYGIVRIVKLCPEGAATIKPFICALTLTSMLYCAMAAVRSLDIKRLIAYSSIVHVNSAILAIYSGSPVGLFGAWLSLISHAFTAAMLFMCAGIIYERLKTRNLLYFSPQDLPQLRFLRLAFALGIFFNMGAPFTLNFLAEALMFVGLYQTNLLIALPAVFCHFVLASIFNLYLLHKTVFAKSVLYQHIGRRLRSGTISDTHLEEACPLIALIILSIGLGLVPNLFTLLLC